MAEPIISALIFIIESIIEPSSIDYKDGEKIIIELADLLRAES